MFDPDGIENLLPPAPPENSLEEKYQPPLAEMNVIGRLEGRRYWFRGTKLEFGKDIPRDVFQSMKETGEVTLLLDHAGQPFKWVFIDGGGTIRERLVEDDPEEQFELQPTDCEWRDCPVCGGTGDEEDGYSHCGNCLGTGVVHQSGSPPPAPPKSSLEEKQGA